MSISSLTMEFKDATTPVNPAVPPVGGAELNATNLELIRAAINACISQLNTQGELTANGRTDANAIAAATGATLYARLFGILDATWGLGGQTPAPKPRISAGNIGHPYALDFVGNGTAHYADGTTTPRSASETYFVFAMTFTDASKTLYRLETVNIVAGNVDICNLTSTHRFIGFSWRIS